MIYGMRVSFTKRCQIQFSPITHPPPFLSIKFAAPQIIGAAVATVQTPKTE
uniref:Uncharacterized protein n=1 Tax=Magallana gigas TaxID=29159 RepID=K1RZ23_MAGGI